MSEIRFNCPTCNQSLEAAEEMANEFVDCPTCKTSVEIPPRNHSSPKGVVPSSPPPLTDPPPATRNYFRGIAVILLLIGLLFLRESADEQFQNRMLTQSYEEHSAASRTYLATAELYLVGGTSRSSVDRAEIRTKEIDEKIDKRKQQLSEMARSRQFKMCLFFAGAAVFLICTVVQSSQTRLGNSTSRINPSTH